MHDVRHLVRAPARSKIAAKSRNCGGRTPREPCARAARRALRAAENDCGIEARFVQRALASAPRVEAIAHRGEWLLLHWYQHEDGEAVRAITRVEPDADRVARLPNYFFNPDCGNRTIVNARIGPS